MTRLAGEFQLDLPTHDASVACAAALDGMGWDVETVEADRIVSSASLESNRSRSRIELTLTDAGDGTTIVRVTGKNPDAEKGKLADQLSGLREAIEAYEQEMVEESAEAQVEEPAEAEPSQLPPAGWYSDPLNSSGQRYWDGNRWTGEVRGEGPGGGSGSGPSSTLHESRDSGNWWQENRRSVFTALLAFFVGAVLGTAAAAPKTETVKRTTTRTTAGPIRTQTETQTRTQTQTVTAAAASGAGASASPRSTSNCDPNYSGACLDPSASDYDCKGGGGDGPKYASGPIVVVVNDHYGLDTSDGDGVACEP